MVDLTPMSPLEGAGLPMEIGRCVIDELRLGQVSAIIPFTGQRELTSRILRIALGMDLPAVGQATRQDGVELIWTGQNQWFLTGAPVPSDLEQMSGITDQSDAWAVLSLRGEDSAEVMARLCPLDLRHFTSGQVARTEFAHMMSIILPREGGYDIWVMRSLSKTALEHLSEAATGLSAIKALPS